jgi:hypothetical protein
MSFFPRKSAQPRSPFCGEAHHGKPDGTTSTGVRMHNVVITLLQAQRPPSLYRIFDVRGYSPPETSVKLDILDAEFRN